MSSGTGAIVSFIWKSVFLFRILEALAAFGDEVLSRHDDQKKIRMRTVWDKPRNRTPKSA
ncbi:hypothetical protein ASB65_16245 [Agrobacterium tumefaciens str. B6]|nr:hypothetical protein ASB65_16245 [Agrobacterium tumefaciens str. B6]MQB27508.1 hypothetical protein [Agrobacterium tumefaciens]OCJ39536.1 hypothetical protein A6U90_19715 [Agrobacterium tumefaciens]